MLPKASRRLFLSLQIVVCLFILMHIFSANPQVPQPELRLEMIYQDEIEVGKEEIIQAVLRNNGTDTAINVTVGLDIPLDAFNITLVRSRAKFRICLCFPFYDYSSLYFLKRQLGHSLCLRKKDIMLF